MGRKATRNETFDLLLGQYLRTKRIESKMSLADIITKSGVQFSKSVLSNIESGRQQIKAYQLFLLIKALDIEIDELVSDLTKRIKLNNNKNITFKAKGENIDLESL